MASPRIGIHCKVGASVLDRLKNPELLISDFKSPTLSKIRGYLRDYWTHVMRNEGRQVERVQRNTLIIHSISSSLADSLSLN